MNKNIIIVILFLLLAVCVVWYLFPDKGLKDKLDALENEKIEIIKERDFAVISRDSLSNVNTIITDSLRAEEQKIKYVPYEKLIYADRNINDAIDILSGYRYNTGTETEN